MADDYEAKHTDLRASAGDAGGERAAVEDPLVELARIVHKNKQSGSKVSTGRIGNTDYFAGLDDVSDETPSAAPQAGTRIEPAFSGLSASANLDFGSGRRGGEGAPAAAPVHDYQTAVPGNDVPSSESSFDQAPQDVTWNSGLGSRTDAERPVETGQDRLTHVSSLWPKDPGEFQPDAAAPHSDSRPHVGDFAPEPVRPDASAELAENSYRAALNPSVSIDLEQNLTAELEDELIGALRQAVDDQSAGRAKSGQDTEPYLSGSPQTGQTAAGGETPAGAFDIVKPQGGLAAEPAYGRTFVRSDARVDRPSNAPEVALGARRPDSAPQRDAESDIFADPRPHREVARPAIDENDFMAALSVSQDDGIPGEAPSVNAAAQGEPAGIDALFADLDFPDPAERGSTTAAHQPRHRTQSERAETGYEDGIWPAADTFPEGGEEEGPPPPEGYDLDAVARAMQESDPSLSGAGVLPPHSRAERAAVPHSGERSRRGLFVAGGVLAVGALGAAGFFLMDSDSVPVPSGPPPIISGLQDPLKVYPEESTASSNDTAKLIYDRVGNENAAGPDRLIVAESPQPAELPPAPADAESGAELVPGATKRVRTLVVRPDGSIISDEDPETPAVQSPAVATPSAGSQPARVVTTTPVVSQEAPEETVESAVSPEPSLLQDVSPAVPDQENAVTEQGAVPAIVQPVSEQADGQPSAPVPSVLPRKKPDAPVQVASTQPSQAAPAPATPNDGPLNLGQTANAPAPAVSASSPSTSGSIAPGTYIVQVTSQRTAAAASDAYSSLQRRYPSILGSRNAVIVSADLGDRGVFYRARIPTGSREEADTLCQSLQGAGGDCFVRRQP